MFFERHLEDNLFALQDDLEKGQYRHSGYLEFTVQDPKSRLIHKPHVRDRVVHQLLYEYLYKLYDKTFIYDSYSCRIGKGTHKGVGRLIQFSIKESQNYSRSCWSVKCDIKKFFANIDHKVLHDILVRKVHDPLILFLLDIVIDSFHTKDALGKGLPLGNLTSQIFANIYMNEFDQFIKHKLKVIYFIHYADDFILVSHNRVYLEQQIEPMRTFLKDTLKLTMHPDKVIFRKLDWGIDFLGYIVLPRYVLPRTATKHRIFRKIKKRADEYLDGDISMYQLRQSVQSYLGYLSHTDGYKLSLEIKNYVWFLTGESV